MTPPLTSSRQSPLPVRRASSAYREAVKPANQRLSVAVRAQQRHSPRGGGGSANGFKVSKAKEKKESKERKEAAGRSKVEDKVSLPGG